MLPEIILARPGQPVPPPQTNDLEKTDMGNADRNESPPAVGSEDPVSTNQPATPEEENHSTVIPPSKTPTPSGRPSPFKVASKKPRRLKLFLWGESGSGKTTLALQFPRPAVIDLEGGTALYGNDFSFDVLPTSNLDELRDAIKWLMAESHDYATLVIDPFTILWELLQAHWSDIFLRRNKKSKGYKFEFYDFQPRDWQTIKSDLKSLLRDLISLDMNVIVTARAKTKYADGEMMKAIGETFDGEKGLPYLFDTIVQLSLTDEGEHIARCIKDRSNKLPRDPFKPVYATFEKLLGRDELARSANPRQPATQDQISSISALSIDLNVSMEKLLPRIETDYGVDALEGLSFENAEDLIAKMTKAVSARNGSATTAKAES